MPSDGAKMMRVGEVELGLVERGLGLHHGGVLVDGTAGLAAEVGERRGDLLAGGRRLLVRLIGGVAGLVELLARGDAGGGQGLLARGLALGVGDGVLGGLQIGELLGVGGLQRLHLQPGGGQRGLPLLHRGLVVARIELEQDLAALDVSFSWTSSSITRPATLGLTATRAAST